MTCQINFKTMLTITMVVGVAFAAPRPDKSDLNNEIIPSGGFASKNGESVSASWGGFHASASLADDGSAVASAGGNGLGASSGYGAGGAGAGASVGGIGAAASEAGSAAGGYGNGGKPSGASGSVQSHPVGAGNGFFDKIFAIPINVLQSVNTYLNQKQQSQGQHGATTQGHHNNNAGNPAAASATATYGGGANKAPESQTGAADYGHESAGKPGSPMMVQTKTNYDEIFNIPITALRSVQNLLNG